METQWWGWRRIKEQAYQRIGKKDGEHDTEYKKIRNCKSVILLKLLIMLGSVLFLKKVRLGS